MLILLVFCWLSKLDCQILRSDECHGQQRRKGGSVYLGCEHRGERDSQFYWKWATRLVLIVHRCKCEAWSLSLRCQKKTLCWSSWQVCLHYLCWLCCWPLSEGQSCQLGAVARFVIACHSVSSLCSLLLSLVLAMVHSFGLIVVLKQSYLAEICRIPKFLLYDKEV